MSEKKKQVIHVKDLVIKADHVTLDRSEQRFGPGFGPRRPQQRIGQEVQEQQPEQIEEQEKEKDGEEQERRPDPFFRLFGRPREQMEPRRRRDYDPILGRPLKIDNEVETTEDESIERKEE